MNVNTLNIGHYRVSDYGRGNCSLFNRESDDVFNITQDEFNCINSHSSIEACEWVEKDAKRREMRKEVGLDVA